MRNQEVIGNATLYLGDCLEILPTIADRIDAVIADPPYGVGFKYATHDDRPEAYEGGYGSWLFRRIEAAEALCKPSSPIFVWQASPNVRNFAEWFPRDWRLFCAAKNFVQMRATTMQYAYDPVIVWWTPGDKRWTAGTANRDFHVANTSALVAKSYNSERDHPCPRPIDQVRHIIFQWVVEGGIVLDPFMGSGTTGVACSDIGRRFIGVESDPGYFALACRRIAAAQSQGRLFA